MFLSSVVGSIYLPLKKRRGPLSFLQDAHQIVAGRPIIGGQQLLEELEKMSAVRVLGELDVLFKRAGAAFVIQVEKVVHEFDGQLARIGGQFLDDRQIFGSDPAPLDEAFDVRFFKDRAGFLRRSWSYCDVFGSRPLIQFLDLSADV